MNSLLLALGMSFSLGVETPTIPTVNYTSDSVVKEGVSLEQCTTETGDIEYNIIVDLPFGYAIYDNPDTQYIDGLQINGRWLESYENVDFKVGEDTLTVKTVYAEDFTGTLAQIHDGTFDWWSLLATPIGILTSVFSGTSIASMLGLAINIIRSKKLKVKDINEIAAESKKVAKEAVEKQNTMTQATLKEFLEGVLIPIVSEIRTEMRDVIKAVAISNSKQKDAPLSILEMLENDTSDEKVKAVIAEAREKFQKALEKEQQSKEAMMKQINAIEAKTSKVIDDLKTASEDEAEGRY